MIRCTVAVAGTQPSAFFHVPYLLLNNMKAQTPMPLCNRSSLTQPRSSQYNNCRSREQSDRTDTESRLLCKALILLLSLSPIREKVRVLTPQGREGSLRAHAYAVRVGYIYLGACYETLLDPVRPPYPSLHFSSLLHPFFTSTSAGASKLYSSCLHDLQCSLYPLLSRTTKLRQVSSSRRPQMTSIHVPFRVQLPAKPMP